MMSEREWERRIVEIMMHHSLPTPKVGEPYSSWGPKLLLALEYLSDMTKAGATLARSLPINGDRRVEDAIKHYAWELRAATYRDRSPQAMSHLPGFESCPVVEGYDATMSGVLRGQTSNCKAEEDEGGIIGLPT